MKFAFRKLKQNSVKMESGQQQQQQQHGGTGSVRTTIFCSFCFTFHWVVGMIKRESERIIKTIPGHRDRRGKKMVIFSRFVRDVIVDAALRNQNESVSL